MGVITIEVPGVPQGKQRVRSGRTRDGRAIHYTPQKTIDYERTVRILAVSALGGFGKANTGAFKVTLDIVMPIPASWSRFKKAEASCGLIHPTVKPDIDNVAKAIFDGLNGAVWKDDAQVVEATMRKRYGIEPKVVVTICAAEPGWSEAQQQEIGL
jgi:Holliday junction resolvase RusA-like endonuclease